MQIKSAKDLIVYQKAYALAMEIFEVSKDFPAEERYSTWLNFAHDSRYLLKDDHAIFIARCNEIGAMLGSMINDRSSFILRPSSDL